MAKPSSSKKQRSHQNPKGTRDFFPDGQLRQRYITDAWRRVALRHGFDEIDGPTFEHLDLYTVKSGEGIVSELFSFQRHGGDDTYALRPEFTPTLARMYAARAKQLSTPVKWFSICNYFRAERPQRGRLREFMQLNCDVIGLGGGDITTESTEDTEKRKAEADGELVVCCASLLEDVGLTSKNLRIGVNHRDAVSFFSSPELSEQQLQQVLWVLDRARKAPLEQTEKGLYAAGMQKPEVEFWIKQLKKDSTAKPISDETTRRGYRDEPDKPDPWVEGLFEQLDARSVAHWCDCDILVVRGLAYYTGTVFEAIAEGERAVAGGGRYDNLIELMGGPPTPAAGFAMGDVVLGNILDDKRLIPDGRELLEALSRPMPVRPDVFVVAASDEAREQVVPLIANLRRGVEADDAGEKKPWDESRYAIAPLHARRSYRSFTTKNLAKIRAKHLSDASACHARFCVIVKDDQTCSIKDLDQQQQTEKAVPIGEAPEVIASGELSSYL